MRMPISILLLFSALTFLPAPTQGGQAAAPDGAALYGKYCASCHQELDKTLLMGRSPSRIRSAIRHFAVMYKLRTLEEAELAAIAAVLAAPQTAAQ